MGKSKNASPYLRTILSTFPRSKPCPSSPRPSLSASKSSSAFASSPDLPPLSSSTLSITDLNTEAPPASNSTHLHLKPKTVRPAKRRMKSKPTSVMSKTKSTAAEMDMAGSEQTASAPKERKIKRPTAPRKRKKKIEQGASNDVAASENNELETKPPPRTLRRAQHAVGDEDEAPGNANAPSAKKAKTSNSKKATKRSTANATVAADTADGPSVSTPKLRKRAATISAYSIPTSLSTASPSDRLIWEMRTRGSDAFPTNGKPARWESICAELEQKHPHPRARKWVASSVRKRFSAMKKSFESEETQTAMKTETADEDGLRNEGENKVGDDGDYVGRVESLVGAEDGDKETHSDLEAPVDAELLMRAKASVEARFELDKWDLIVKELREIGGDGKTYSGEALRKRVAEIETQSLELVANEVGGELVDMGDDVTNREQIGSDTVAVGTTAGEAQKLN